MNLRPLIYDKIGLVGSDGHWHPPARAVTTLGFLKT